MAPDQSEVLAGGWPRRRDSLIGSDIVCLATDVTAQTSAVIEKAPGC